MQDQIVGVARQVPTVVSSVQHKRIRQAVRADVGGMNDSILKVITVQLREIWRLGKHSHAPGLANNERDGMRTPPAGVRSSHTVRV
jgi:hypothetical protein